MALLPQFNAVRIVVWTLLTLRCVQGFYWIQWTPNYFHQGDEVLMYVNKAESDETQLPYSYYDLPFTCPPTDKALPQSLSLGEVLRGDRIWGSDYHLFFQQDDACKRLCNRIVVPAGARRTAELIKKGYVVEWILDGLPGATTFVSTGTEKKMYYAAGFPIGFVEDGKTYIHNHVMLVIRWHKEDGDRNKKTIVGFEVYPKSVSDHHCPGASKNFKNFEIDPTVLGNVIIPFTYSVYWREQFDLSWKDRWNLYFAGEGDQSKMHWFSLVNSVVVILFLSTVVGAVLIRTLSKDISSVRSSSYYNSRESHTVKDLPDDIIAVKPTTGWRSIENDVFITPTRPLLLSVLAASGVQLSITIVAVLCLCVSGLIGPTHRGSILSVAVFFFLISGFVAGFSGVQFFKVFSTGSPDPISDWKKISLYCSSALTVGIFGIVFIMNLFVWAKGSTFALPFGTFMVLILGCLTLELPLGILGGFFSNKTSVASYLVSKFSKAGTGIRINHSTNDITVQKSIPRQPLYNRPLVMIPLFGLFPFGMIYVELIYIFRSMWQEKTTFYYMYGFLFCTMTLLVVVIVETSIVSTFLRLNAKDYQWQWSSFLVGASITFYMMLYCIYYFAVYLRMSDITSILLFFIYSFLANSAVGMACGSIGLISSAIFVHTIYGAIKSD
ncbi:unnamed protein product [Kuraishia capsulata CBS 1993]|uniref:Transmembrane 9 superfamily member n=1 Tax=Kuraishia capsulata CBS 1993 TaxID=1382522 RepID=W6MMK1_9ASCO|nr:uncharacterized protein KUCA_T00003803001 [Kuraishia capsulata CBS 1993]CDK27824.1 unnamed protein product [Kuraishia capsulata CBS 1993]